MKALRIFPIVFFLLFSNFCYSETLQECKENLAEMNEIIADARRQIEELTQVRDNKDELIEKHKLKISLLEKRIALLKGSDEMSDEMIALLKENQDLCLATESNAYELMRKIMVDYKEAVDKATLPWFLDLTFYGGVLIGAAIIAAL